MPIDKEALLAEERKLRRLGRAMDIAAALLWQVDLTLEEAQRRYVECFSAYARQFLDRMDKPDVESIEGIPPTIAIDQSRPVKTSRSTVGTMTELHDHFKLLFSKIAELYCRGCDRLVERDSTQSVFTKLSALPDGAHLVVAFPLAP